VDDIRTREKPEYIQIQTSKMLLRKVKPFIKAWAQPGDDPNNFKVKPKLNMKMNQKFIQKILFFILRTWKIACGHNINGQPTTKPQLARLLGRFGIKSRSVEIYGHPKRGYFITDFKDAFMCYIPSTVLPIRKEKLTKVYKLKVNFLRTLDSSPMLGWLMNLKIELK
jgi:hypothetical protein